MSGLSDTLASDAAQEIVKALVAGMTEAVGKVPSLWRRSGRRKEELIEAEIQQAALALQDPEDLPATVSRQEGAWEGRLRDLLAESPEATAELRDMLEALRSRMLPAARLTQHVTAHTGGTAAGAMFGSVIVHHHSAVKPGQASANEASAGAKPEEDGHGHR